jgi:hypothetical protein
MQNCKNYEKIVDITDALHVDAFNAAFHELGLPWYWDVDLYRSLNVKLCEKARMKQYLETHQPHLLRIYEADALTDMILSLKDSRYKALQKSGLMGVDWASVQSKQIGI